jgi:hypothetical protein
MVRFRFFYADYVSIILWKNDKIFPGTRQSCMLHHMKPRNQCATRYPCKVSGFRHP